MTTLNLEQRNAEICRAFHDGFTQEQVAEKYGITHQRVSQIWAQAKLKRRRRDVTYLGVFIPSDVKEAIRLEQLEDNKSLTKIVEEALREHIAMRAQKKVRRR